LAWPRAFNFLLNLSLERLTCQTVHSEHVQRSTSPLLGSPITPSSSTHSLSPMSRMFDDFSLDENPSGTSDELLMGPLYPEEHDMLNRSSTYVPGGAESSEGLHLRIPTGGRSTLDEQFPSYPSAIDNFDGISLERSFQDFFELAGTIIDRSYPLDENHFNHNECEISPSQSSFSVGSPSSSFHGSGPLSFPASPMSPTSPLFKSGINASSAALLSPEDLPSDGDSSVMQHRRSYSDGSIFSSHLNPGNSAPFSSSPLSPTDNMADRTSTTSHYHSDTTGFASSTAVEPSQRSFLSPDHVPGQSLLQRRHSHSNGTHPRMPENHDQPLRRTRSTMTVRNRSPYARNRELSTNDFPANDGARGSPQPVDPLLQGNHTAESSSQCSSQEDIFRTYDDRSGIGYPILHRDTIASDAVLLASSKRRKKVANYKCTTCGQLLTSKDNLNNHQDAHEGIRRHQCDYCHERFRTRSVLKRHQKSAKCPGSRLIPKEN